MWANKNNNKDVNKLRSKKQHYFQVQIIMRIVVDSKNIDEMRAIYTNAPSSCHLRQYNPSSVEPVQGQINYLLTLF